MKICLHKCEEHKRYGPILLEIKQRLPFFVKKITDVVCFYTVTQHRSHYLLELEVKAKIAIECQRCLHGFIYNYINVNKIAVCKDDKLAEKMMADYESLVSLSNEVDLVEVVADDLYLFCPEKHEILENCVLK